MEELFKLGTHYVAMGVEAAAALVIALAVVRAMVRIARLAVGAGRDERGASAEETKEAIRIGLGRWLALALELTLAADILRTAIAPTWNEIGQLAAIVVLRTVLNYFLQREIASERVEQGERVERVEREPLPRGGAPGVAHATSASPVTLGSVRAGHGGV